MSERIERAHLSVGALTSLSAMPPCVLSSHAMASSALLDIVEGIDMENANRTHIKMEFIRFGQVRRVCLEIGRTRATPHIRCREVRVG